MAEGMVKMDGASKDILAERIENLKALIPEAFADGKIDFDSLRAALGDAVDTSKANYSFTWNGKNEARAFAFAKSMGTLRPCKEESAGIDGTAGRFDSKNLYIEGDNLEVLKLLQGAYHGRVKMIYLDPPYNTGKDFVYTDNFKSSIENYKISTGQVDGEGKCVQANVETSGRYHTDWLNMMFPRLLLARNLLRNDGIIFISIDDYEVTNMRKLCDEVFGENNFLAQLIWDLGTGTQAGHFVRAHEYVLAYFKAKGVVENFKGGSGVIDHSALKKISVKNPASNYTFKAGTRWDAGNGAELSGQWGGAEKTTLVQGSMVCVDGKLASDVVLSAGWAMRAQMDSYFKGEITYDTKGQLVKSFYFNENGVLRYEKERSVVNPPTVLKGLGSTKNGTDEVESLIGFKAFDFPKPTSLCKFLAELTCSGGDIILDAFSGSGSFSDAIMRLNAGKSESSERVSWIAIQLPAVCAEDSEAAKAGYKNICEIGKERIRRAGKKIADENAAKAPMLDIGFKVFKLDTSNLIPWNPNPEDLEHDLLAVVDNAVVGRTAEDLLYEILLKCNLPLTLPIEERKFGANTISVAGDGKLMVCLDKTIPVAVAEEMVRLRDEVYKPSDMQVVFRDNGFSDKDKTNAIMTLKQAGVEDKAIMTI